MRVLLTGAFGNIGTETLRLLLEAGHHVRCFDLDTPSARKAARPFQDAVEFFWGDMTQPDDVAGAVFDQEAVIHDAAVLPPASEEAPERTRRVNVEVTRRLVAACEASKLRPKLVFASSISIFGLSQDRPPPRRVEEPIAPTDHYSRSKADGEEIVRGSSLDWVILRFAAAPPDRTPGWREFDLERFFQIDPDTRIEYLHPKDAALAQVNALSTPEAVGRIWLIGGGKECQVRMREFHGAYFEAMGIGSLPDAAFGDESYYTDWMDTEESQRLFRYQRHTFDDLRSSQRRNMRFVRPWLRLLRGPIRRFMLSRSPYA
jgi:nucleoside-diphosphate-sugar epimerase